MIGLSDLASFKSVAIAALIGLVIGFSAGFYTAKKFEKANLVDGLVASREITANRIVDSVERSGKIEAKAQASDSKIDAIRKQFDARFKTEIKNEKCSSGWTLSIDDVRVLNDARVGSVDSATSIGNDKGGTPSDITLAEFIDNDLQVVRMYRSLAIRHDALVDYVNELVRQQLGK